MKRYLQSFLQKTYGIPTLYCLFALAFSLGVHWFNLASINWHISPTLDFLYQSIPVTRNMLSVMTGSLLSMITVTFSTIMVVLTLYSGQFSPKTLQDFLRSKTSLHVLGSFMGVFIYAISQLYFVQGNAAYSFVISGSIGMVFTTLSLILFAYFIHHVANAIQVHLVIERITKDIFNLLEKKEKKCLTHKNCPVKTHRSDLDEDISLGTSSELISPVIGYIQNINSADIVNYAKKNQQLLRLEQSLGDYITKETVLFTRWHQEFTDGENISKEEYKQTKDKVKTLDDDHDKKSDSDKALFEAITVGEDRNSEEDVEYGLIKLVEVALRAISPGINDPNTAILCIKKIGYVLAEIAQTNAHKTYYYDDEKHLRLILNKIPFKTLLYQSFSQIKIYGCHDYSVLGACLEALISIAQQGLPEIKRLIWDFSIYLFEGLDIAKFPTLDRTYILSKINELAFMTGHNTKDFLSINQQ